MSSTVLQGAADGFLARFEGLRERLPGERILRARAAKSFRASGLPAAQVLAALAELELAGRIEFSPGGGAARV